MATNVGSIDRTVRIVLRTVLGLVGSAGYIGMVSLAWIDIGQALAVVVIFLVGPILLVIGFRNSCPIYSVLGMGTARSPNPTPPVSSGVDVPHCPFVADSAVEPLR